MGNGILQFVINSTLLGFYENVIQFFIICGLSIFSALIKINKYVTLFNILN